MLQNLYPTDVFSYFERLCAIPHGSYHTDRIADYVVSFAQEQGLKYLRDSRNNVIIFKPAQNCDSQSTVIIQGHLDMVCAKDDTTQIDFEKEGIRLDFDESYVFAKGTTLGGDDGIAVAMALAVLSSKTISHPSLECVFTTDEEVGMLGANALDMSVLKGKYMLNIDSEDEGELTVSCAGGETLVVEMKNTPSAFILPHTIKLSINGLLGGHSGVEIDKGRANAISLMGKLVAKIKQKTAVQLVSIDGGQKDNAIALESEAKINVESMDAVYEEIEKFKAGVLSQYSQADPNIKIIVEKIEHIQGKDSNVFEFLSSVTNGVRSMSREIEGLVQTSSNLGIVRTNEENTTITLSLRSSVEEEKDALHNEIELLAKGYGAEVSSFGKYPAWEYKKASRLQELCKKTFEAQYGYSPKIVAIHAGLECGIFTSKIPNLDCISFGPNILDIHTSKEKMEIASVGRVYSFLLELLKKL